MVCVYVFAGPTKYCQNSENINSFRGKQFFKMIGQKTIASYFTPAVKRTLSEVSEEEIENGQETNREEQEQDGMRTPVKKLKADPEGGEAPAKPSCPLSPEQLSRIERNKQAALQRLAARNVPPGFGESWKKELLMEFSKPYFIKLMGFVALERKRWTVYPPPHQVFTWTEMCNIHDVKVVILGQDPYHGPNQAHGLCFSVKRPVPPPPSLENMYKELQSDIEGFEPPMHGDLTGWAKQGVLLLNAVLTVRAHQANSHKERGWEEFTDAVVSYLNNNLDGLVFMLWGAYAQRKGSVIDRKRHHVLQTVHPSPLSAHRGFFGCKHFSRTNELLKKSGKTPINWKLL
ncbi:uracil-DNA glycosylase-like [Heterodontus francisci]|uniref:uracil-DNA glycosylase-like n=1 Tax=Heterodontus francisci TaxID=7792 RepID=UPI00355C1FCB